MANLTTRLGFGFEHQEFAVSQNQGAAEELWNRLGLEGFVVATPLAYGPPFVDFNLELFAFIDRAHKMYRDIAARFPSSRVDINGESEP